MMNSNRAGISWILQEDVLLDEKQDCSRKKSTGRCSEIYIIYIPSTDYPLSTIAWTSGILYDDIESIWIVSKIVIDVWLIHISMIMIKVSWCFAKTPPFCRNVFQASMNRRFIMLKYFTLGSLYMRTYILIYFVA